ncbi:solute carrier family 2, facilitated glucose transporter member 8-like [Dermacentor albipictus]|uniref:solute carrier family 2, facilitated glucose transporter member 8-like n=1 Tax=Dermacentor albipictus TaxID=60249 RepID=UPI0038FCA141
MAARSFHLVRFRKTWLCSVLAMAALVGSLVSGFLIERFGRVRPIQLSSLGFVGGCRCIALFNASLPWMFAGLVLTGICYGLVSPAVPVFVAEISPPHVRGLLDFGAQLAITLRVLVAFVDGKWLDWLAPLCCVPRAPRSWPSPRTPPSSPSAGWLRRDKALDALRLLCGSKFSAEAECLIQLRQPAAMGDLLQHSFLMPLAYTLLSNISTSSALSPSMLSRYRSHPDR